MSSCVATGGTVSECKIGANSGMKGGSVPNIEATNASTTGDACVLNTEANMVPSMKAVDVPALESVSTGSVDGGDVLGAVGGEDMGNMEDNVFVEGENEGGDDIGAISGDAGLLGANIDGEGAEIEVKNEE